MKEQTPMQELNPRYLDYYLNCFKWYRKYRKCNWYQHEFTPDALELSVTFVGTFWALYPEINRYSKVIEIETYNAKYNNQIK